MHSVTCQSTSTLDVQYNRNSHIICGSPLLQNIVGLQPALPCSLLLVPKLMPNTAFHYLSRHMLHNRDMRTDDLIRDSIEQLDKSDHYS